MLRLCQNDQIDALGLYDLLVEMHGHMGMKLPAIVPEKLLRTVAKVLQEGRAWLWEDKGRMRGVLALVRDAPWWSDKEHLVDTAFFVAPDVRAKRAAFRLLDAAEEYAKLERLPLYVGLFTGKDLHRKELLLARRGYHKVGSTMVRV